MRISAEHVCKRLQRSPALVAAEAARRATTQDAWQDYRIKDLFWALPAFI